MTAPDRPRDHLRRKAATHRAGGDWAAVITLLAPHADDDGELAALLGEALLRTGRAREAQAVLAPAPAVLARRGQRAVLRSVWNLLGAAHFELGQLDDAEEAFSAAAELGRADGDAEIVARATVNLGAVANVRGHAETALLLYALAVPAYQRIGHTAALAATYHNMAISYRDQGQLDRAEELERRAIDYAREAEATPYLAMARLGRAELALRRGDGALAEAGAAHALALVRTLGDPLGEADAWRLIGAARLAQPDRLEDAAVALTNALSVARRVGSVLVEAETRRAMADLAARRGEPSAATAHAEEAARLFEKMGAGPQAAEALEVVRRLGAA